MLWDHQSCADAEPQRVDRTAGVVLKPVAVHSGFFWVQASPGGLAFMDAWLGEAYNASSLMDVWEQLSFTKLVWRKPPLLRCCPVALCDSPGIAGTSGLLRSGQLCSTAIAGDDRVSGDLGPHMTTTGWRC